MRQEYIAMIAVAAVVMSTLAVAYVVLDDDKEPESTYKYTLYVGMLKSDGTEIDDLENAKEVIRGIILDHGSGYTEIEGYGGYLDNGGAVNNVTLIYVLVFIDDDTVHGIIEEIKSALDIQAILCEKQIATAEMI